MKVVGFTFIKDAVKYDYPIVEAILSILPVCSQIVVTVGKSSDETLQLIKQINTSKIIIIETVWDETIREGGQVLAVETNKAFQAISNDADWAFYIQGDEIVHEKYLPIIERAMEDNLNNPEVDGLLFHYKHFYGSYDYVATSSGWYKNEIRVIKNNKKIYSYKDAQGFRKNDNEKLKVKAIDAFIYHYGWIKDPRAMQKKQVHFNSYWHDDEWLKTNVANVQEFDYASHIKELALFTDTHPKIMLPRIKRLNWIFSYDISLNKKTMKEKAKDFLQRYFGLDFNYKNYTKI